MELETDQQKSGSIDVHVRRVHCAGGREERSISVYCGPRERFVALAECAACEHGTTTLDPASSEWSVLCERAPPAVDPDAPSDEHVGDAATYDTLVGAVMTRDVVCVREDLTIEDLVALLLKHGISGTPVVAEEGRAIGIVSRTDVLVHAAGGGAEGADAEPLRVCGASGRGTGRIRGQQVRAIMSPLVFALHRETSVARAAALMAYEGVHRLPVVADDGVVIGIISPMDIARWVARCAGYVVPGRRRGP